MLNIVCLKNNYLKIYLNLMYLLNGAIEEHIKEENI